MVDGTETETKTAVGRLIEIETVMTLPLAVGANQQK
jgi:hypothetical protein